ncbi:hypothetical protein HanIR_Chr02g0060881 [Helianthus annuus]|nr:hypothetical protein HanIR_Chr02g0060881 [Helianthus annuus]
METVVGFSLRRWWCLVSTVSLRYLVILVDIRTVILLGFGGEFECLNILNNHFGRFEQ